MSVTIGGDGQWEEKFLAGVAAACEAYGLPLVGGDTIALPEGAPRVLGLTAIGRGSEHVPSRAGGKPGDRLWVIGLLGDAAAGLSVLLADAKAEGTLVEAYRRPVPATGRRARARAPCHRDDGRIRRTAARCFAAMLRERLRREDRSRQPAAVARLYRRTRIRTAARACRRPPAATIMPCSPRSRPISTPR